ncbi:DUF397 domain-containing protein [Streptomyces sp. 796.1]|uniref:DUF397 domain-containing protein n=1 Tax=Streptomyces sp. 796.1 TaxID=3163029 RepID=UPI0039C9A694
MTGYIRTDAANVGSLTWRKSSYSGGEQGQCVEVAETASAVHVRDSKNPDGPVLLFPAGSFTGFVSGIKNGEFDI